MAAEKSVNPVCFVISPIGTDGSEARACADKTLNFIIAPAAQAKGFIVERADKITAPGLITTQVIQKLLDAKLVIADLTDHNPNVFYELAVRHATGKPVVHIIFEGQKIPFDVAPHRTVFYSHDIEKGERAKLEIIDQIASVLADPNAVDNPLAASLNQIQLKASGKPAEAQMAEMFSLMQSLRADVAVIAGGARRADDEKVVRNPDSKQSTMAAIMSLMESDRKAAQKAQNEHIRELVRLRDEEEALRMRQRLGKMEEFKAGPSAKGKSV